MVGGLMMGDKDRISETDDILLSVEWREALEEVRAAAAANWGFDMEEKLARGENWVARHIGSRVDRGREWHEKFGALKELAESSRYIRILGNGFRPVSISGLNPCGHLRDGKGEIECLPTLDLATVAARNATEEKPGNNKPEAQLQAFLIRAAMRNDLDLSPVLRQFPDVFDQLLFVTDELSLNAKVRADIVALGCKADACFPVFIELKVGRHLTKLMEQLDNACKALWDCEETRTHFSEFLSAVTGKPLDRVRQTPDAACKMLIWPKSESGKEHQRVKAARKDGWLIVDFEGDFDSGYTFSQNSG